MSDVFIGDLPAAVTVSGGDVLPLDQGNQTVKATVAQIRAIPPDGLSGDAVHGGTISAFASTGIDDHAAGKVLTLSANGRAGIGTAAPTAALEVAGTIKSSGAVPGHVFDRADAPANQRLWIAAPTATSLIHYIVNDAGQAPAPWLTVDRNGASVSALRLHTGAGLERAVLDTDGNLAVGSASPAYHRFQKNRGEGQTILDLVTPTNQSSAFFEVAGTGVGVSPTAARFQKNSATGRSINAAGTVNATGLDYAEYMEKRADCGTIAKGRIAGVDGDGRLTDRLDLAHSFVVKSTSPSYVGGDALTEARLGTPPMEPVREDGEEETAFTARREDWAAAMAAWQERAEAERVRFDRMAFCGQVPVDVAEPWAVGDYVAAARKPDGAITAVAVSVEALDADAYRRSVGRIWRRGGDGRPVMAVKVV